jgi:hypothetical protein
MKKYLVSLIIAGALLTALVGPTAAEGPTPNGNNCAGVVVSSLAGQDFGQSVSTFAHAQLVDNFGLADCGQDNRNNP